MFAVLKKLLNVCQRRITVISAVILAAAIVIQSGIAAFHICKNDYSANRDATNHAVMMIQTMLSNPVRSHFFLPHVTYSGALNRNIEWGACLKNKSGMFFYLSFPPAYVFLPYAICKITGIEASVRNAEIFSCILNIITTLLLFILLQLLLQDQGKNAVLFALIGSVLYLFAPEVLNASHEYWAHMLFQPLFLLFLIAAVRSFPLYYNDNNSIPALLFVYIAGTLLVLTEWSAFLVLLSVFMFYLIAAIYWAVRKNQVWKNFGILSISIASAGLSGMLIFYVQMTQFFDFQSMILHFGSRRNERAYFSINQLFCSYSDSLGSIRYLLFAIMIIIIFAGILRIEILPWGKKSLLRFFALTLLSGAAIENLIIPQHAFLYSYDRLKVVLLVVVIISLFFGSLLDDEKKNFFSQPWIGIPVILISFAVVSSFSCRSLLENEKIIAQRITTKLLNIMDVSYVRELNELFQKLNLRPDDCLFIANSVHRSNINIAFHRNLLIMKKRENVLQYFKNHRQLKAAVYVSLLPTARDIWRIKSMELFHRVNGIMQTTALKRNPRDGLFLIQRRVPDTKNAYYFTDLLVETSDNKSNIQSVQLDNGIKGKIYWNKKFPFIVIDPSFRLKPLPKSLCYIVENDNHSARLILKHNFFCDDFWHNGWAKNEKLFYLPLIFKSLLKDGHMKFPDGSIHEIDSIIDAGDYSHVKYTGDYFSGGNKFTPMDIDFNLVDDKLDITSSQKRN